jgi:hypothetical protein
MRARCRLTTGCNAERNSNATARLPVLFHRANGVCPSGTRTVACDLDRRRREGPACDRTRLHSATDPQQIRNRLSQPHPNHDSSLATGWMRARDGAVRHLLTHSSRMVGGGPIQKSRSPGAHSRSGGSLPHPRDSGSDPSGPFAMKAQAGRARRAPSETRSASRRPALGSGRKRSPAGAQVGSDRDDRSVAKAIARRAPAGVEKRGSPGMIVGDDTRTRVRPGRSEPRHPHAATTLARPREDPAERTQNGATRREWSRHPSARHDPPSTRAAIPTPQRRPTGESPP